MLTTEQGGLLEAKWLTRPIPQPPRWPPPITVTESRPEHLHHQRATRFGRANPALGEPMMPSGHRRPGTYQGQ